MILADSMKPLFSDAFLLTGFLILVGIVGLVVLWVRLGRRRGRRQWP